MKLTLFLLCISLFFTNYLYSPERPLLAGHRGLPSLFPENTIPSFRAAVKADVDYIEFDVLLSKDKKRID